MKAKLMAEDPVLHEIRRIASQYRIGKLVLFGSRARGNNSLVSDYDIAVFADNMSAFDQASLWQEIEEIDTLKKIDLIFVNDNLAEEFLNSVKRDGVTIYG